MASVKQGGICRAVYRASQSLGGLGPLSSCAQRQFCKRATPFHDPGPRKFLQFHATTLWCRAQPDTSPPGAGMRYSRCAVYWSYPRVEHQIVRPPSFESDRWSPASWLLPAKYPEEVVLPFRRKSLGYSMKGKRQPASRHPPDVEHWFGHAAREKPECPRQARYEIPRLFSTESPCESRYPAAAIRLLIHTRSEIQGVAPDRRSRLPDDHLKARSACTHRIGY